MKVILDTRRVLKNIYLRIYYTCCSCV